MIIKQDKPEMSEFAEQIIFGVRKAVRQLVEKSAANDESLIVGDGKGNFGPVPAKELLKNYDK
jgi:hypothetical protein